MVCSSSLGGERRSASGDSRSAFFQYVIHAPFSSASLREAGLLLRAKWRRAKCRLESSSLSLFLRKAFWDVESSAVSCSGHHGVQASEAFAHIAMETVVCSSLEKDKTNPFPCLCAFFFFFKAILKPGVRESTLRGSPSLHPLQNQTHKENSENCVTYTHLPHAQKIFHTKTDCSGRSPKTDSVYDASAHIPPGKSKHDK